MAARNKIGDIFEVQLTTGGYRYFQFVALDETLLNSDVIAVYAGAYPQQQDPGELQPTVDFFAHTTVKAGLERYWRRVGHQSVAASEQAVFCEVDGSRELQAPDEGPSQHWSVWHINEEPQYVGAEQNIPSHAEPGIVFSPISVYQKITTGQYGQTYYGHHY